MRLALPLLTILTLAAWLPAAGPCFDTYFEDAALRVDYYQTGHHTQEFVTLDQLYRTETWPGSPSRLIDDLNAGPYCVKVYDVATNALIFSRGFSCIFAEYKTTTPARNGIMHTYHATATIPFPRKPVLFVLEARDRRNLLAPIFSTEIDPADINIIKETPNEGDRIHTVAQSGPPRQCLDLVFVAEGYTADQYDTFAADADRFAGVLLNAEPFKTHKYKINVAAVFRPSAQPGVDEPDKAAFSSTAVSSAYNALGLDRYLLVDDNKALRDIAGRIPYDTLVILANSTRYGGGGIYNDYCIVTANHSTSERIFLHEFGHSFANLADEYFSAEVAYDEFFAPGTEPLEPNITALLDPENVKWKDLLTPGIPIPTPWGQEEIESLRSQKESLGEKAKRKIARLEAKDAPNKAIEKVRNKLAAQNRTIDEKIRKIKSEYQDKYGDKIGVFEGAGYTAKGLYRSCIDVGFVRGDHYNTVSRRAIDRIIAFYTQ